MCFDKSTCISYCYTKFKLLLELLWLSFVMQDTVVLARCILCLYIALTNISKLFGEATCHVFNAVTFCALSLLLQTVSLCPGLAWVEMSGSCSGEGILTLIDAECRAGQVSQVGSDF